jgi:hypothetical protein
MNSTDDSTPDPLTREYQRASSTEAGRPSDATRAAILAEARAAALRRMPAANNSRFVWRAVAGIAVIGVAVLLWRQAGQPLPVTAHVEPPAARSEAPQPAAVPAAAASEESPARAAKSVTNIVNQPQPVALKTERRRADTAVTAEPVEVASAASADAAPPSLKARVSEMQLSAPAARSAAETNATRLLRHALPAAYDSATPPTITWVLQDRDDRILRQGSLDASQTLESVRTELTKEFPDRRIGPWVVSPVSNSRGVTLQLGVARME